MKRLFDIVASAFGLAFSAPILLPTMIVVWARDFHSPLYIATRIGLDGRAFRMVKLRSMVVNADRTKVNSTSDNDRRITPVGKFIRASKLDELTQLWNVLVGDMSLVGPRPNVEAGVALYTDEERTLLTVRPGITDFASIVFADEGQILRDSTDPDRDYDLLIRPWKSRLGLLYIAKQNVGLDLVIVFITLLALVSRPKALEAIGELIAKLGADSELVRVARRTAPLFPTFPPGSESILGAQVDPG